MKDATENEILPVAAEVRKLCNDYGAIFIIDDHVELVKEIRADGVHLARTTCLLPKRGAYSERNIS